MRIAVVGLGLIGGSLAKTIKAKTDYHVAGFDISKEVISKALSEATIDEYTNVFSSFDLILISLFPKDTINFLENHIDEFSSNCLVVDCCGVKEVVCQSAELLFKDSPAIFIGGHPMAGREFSGYDNSLPTLFENASMILTPIYETNKLEYAEDFFYKLGFKQVTVTTPQHHDEIIAYTSQLAHVVSSAYMQSPTAKKFSGFSAGSFKDLTRVAKLNPDMWTELFICNKKALSKEVEVLINTLEKFREYIDSSNEQSLNNILKMGSKIKEDLSRER